MSHLAQGQIRALTAVAARAVRCSRSTTLNVIYLLVNAAQVIDSADTADTQGLHACMHVTTRHACRLAAAY